MWKTVRHFLREVEGIDVASPKGAIRSSRETSLLTTAKSTQALVMADDRNLTSRTYDRELALEIYQRLYGHADLMAVWLERISEA
ncbi:nucleotidyltransferase substrate binding protein [Ferroacidibacillus organovorans]|uniref:nucleotidyltransferase substrate binding protein n=1 Tax=Ferroacidibacillus organovorans TaxID=1765683 RepID=UPI00191091A2|nr:nucleotidyltransferase substrate binding protein [Ferroacidibacillus organovorans]